MQHCFMCGIQAAITDCLHGMGGMCKALLEQLKADAKLAVKQALSADGPFELSPQASCLIFGQSTSPTTTVGWLEVIAGVAAQDSSDSEVHWDQ